MSTRRPAHKARKENRMKNCNALENQTTRRILPMATRKLDHPSRPSERRLARLGFGEGNDKAVMKTGDGTLPRGNQHPASRPKPVIDRAARSARHLRDRIDGRRGNPTLDR